MKRLVLLFLMAVSLLAVLPVVAGNNTLTGTITGNFRFIASPGLGCSLYDDGRTYFYEVYTIYVSEPGDYIYLRSDVIGSTLAVFVSPGFNPDDPTANCIFSEYGNGTVTFPYSGSYTIVVSSEHSKTEGVFSFSLNGPGDVYYVTPEEPETPEAEPLCANPLPTSSVVHSVPAGAPVFYEPSLDAQIDMTLPAGTWWITQLDGDFVEVWIACDANLVWIPASAVGAPIR